MPLRYMFERPATTGVTGLLFEALHAFDMAYNRAPSLHISVLVILWVRFAACALGWLRVALAIWFLLIGVSVLTTYQHYVIDVAGGIFATCSCLRLFDLVAKLKSIFHWLLSDGHRKVISAVLSQQ